MIKTYATATLRLVGISILFASPALAVNGYYMHRAYCDMQEFRAKIKAADERQAVLVDDGMRKLCVQYHKWQDLMSEGGAEPEAYTTGMDDLCAKLEGTHA